MGGGVVAMAGRSWGAVDRRDGNAPGESTIDDVPEPVHTLMVQFSTYVRLFFRVSNDRKVRGAVALQLSTGSDIRGTTTWVNSFHWPSGAPLARRHTRLPYDRV